MNYKLYMNGLIKIKIILEVILDGKKINIIHFYLFF